ncbi:MAG: hypothetical protein ACOH2A_08395 [Sphingobacteriaceae bacterium]
MKKLFFLTLCLYFHYSYAQTQKAAYLSKEDLSKSVLLLAADSGTASGLLLNVNNDIYIVTTEQISERLSKKSKVYMTGNNSKFVELPLNVLFENRDFQWKYSVSADLAMLKIATDTSKYFSTIKSHALDYTRLYYTHDTIAKNTPVTVFGHAVADTINGTIIPVANDSQIPSGQVSIMENNIRYTYYLIPIPNMNGFIGGPVFAALKPTGKEIPNLPKTVLIGIIHDYFLGGASAQMIPAGYLNDLISN